MAEVIVSKGGDDAASLCTDIERLDDGERALIRRASLKW